MRWLHLALVILALMAPTGATLGSEPEGRLLLNFVVVPRGNGATIRLSVAAAVDATGLRLTLETPRGLRVTSRRFTGRSGSFGSLLRGESTSEEFDVAVTAGRGNIATFRVDGIDGDGRAFTQRVGVPVGVPGAAPTIRGGAAEFPAALPKVGE